MSYTYHLYHVPTQSHYYGVRFIKGCSPDELWVKYFSSSKRVKTLIKEYGPCSFRVEVRRTFATGEEALLWENRVLTRLDAAHRPDWLNEHNGGNGRWKSPTQHSQKTKDRIKQAITGKVRSPETRAAMSRAAHLREARYKELGIKGKGGSRNFGRVWTPEQRARLSAAKRAADARRKL